MTTGHLAQHIRHDGLVSNSTLHVIAVSANPSRWQSRVRLGRKWLDDMERTPYVRPYFVEAAFGDRHHEVAATDDARHLRLRTTTEAWIKEPLVNLGARYLLPRDWKYVAWVDADVEFRDPRWASETLHQLQHFPILQPWQHCVDLGPTGNVVNTHQSYGWVQQSGRTIRRPADRTKKQPYSYPAHSGYAWACTRRFWEAVRGLMDHCILGAGDHHMAWGCLGDIAAAYHGKSSAGYKRRSQEWSDQAHRVTHGQIGYVAGRIEHAWHGSKVKRGYFSRWKLLVDFGYDPDTDMTYDEQGLVTLRGNKPDFEHAIRQYNRSRGEDSIDEA